MEKSEINKRVDYITSKLETLNLAIIDYNENKVKFERYKSLKTIERDCEEIIESAIRINQEILQDGGKLGGTYRESFELLEDFDEFKDPEFLEKLSNSCGFRNRLAHDYINLDDEITVRSAKKILEIYPNYLLKIKKLIK